MFISSSQYDPKATEGTIYKQWEEGGAFGADAASDKQPFSISMPPPNATGELHVGHALFLTLQDILIRQARMEGKEALWVPGTDHAAIATESVVIRNLQKDGIRDPRKELGREELVNRIRAFVQQSRGTIKGQIRSMGASCDWTRERFTMDGSLNRVVSEVFTRMYNDGLIYRGGRIVHWDPKLQTTVSDDELEYVQETTTLYTFTYGPFEIATARPETKFGDKYVVMHPDDPRYKQYDHGDTFEAEWINGPVTATVIKDETIDPEFGTGVMTITPWHDINDFDIAQRHDLDKEQIIGFDGTLLPVAQEFSGMPIAKARPKIVEKLRKKGLVAQEDTKYIHNVAVNSRGKGVIEPQIKTQWFVDVHKPAVTWKGKKQSLKAVMQDVVRSNDITLFPKRYEKTYFHWIDNLRDWCISRQIWWGHRIPAWYKEDDVYVGIRPPDGDNWQQDPDTLDTWFSSALWTWSTLIDTDKAQDTALSLEQLLEQSPDVVTFHPTSVMETGHDILFFWVARMILMTTYATGDIPFKDVFLHGLIVTKSGKKMSKSDPDSVIDPMDMIETYGADALRFGLTTNMHYGRQHITFSEQAVQKGRNMANKLWNIGRLVASLDAKRTERSLADDWIEGRIHEASKHVTRYLHSYRFGEAMRCVYDLMWKDFADWYAEIVKHEGSTAAARDAFATLLRLAHPFMPFVTEALWQQEFSDGKSMLISSAWPHKPYQDAPAAARDMKTFRAMVSVVRSWRKLLDIPTKDVLEARPPSPQNSILPDAFAALTRTQRTDDTINDKPSLLLPVPGISPIMLASDLLSPERLRQAHDKLQHDIAALQEKLSKDKAVLNSMQDKAAADIIKEKKRDVKHQQDDLAEKQIALQVLEDSINK